MTDDSKYLREQFADGRELKYFSLKETAALPEIASALLRDTQVLEEMAVRGREKGACITYMAAARSGAGEKIISFTNKFKKINSYD